jgi:thiamine-phosphate pyrophosphorylase
MADHLKHVSKSVKRFSNTNVRENQGFPSLTFFTDPVRTPNPAAIVTFMPQGSAVIFRHFGAENAAAMAHKLRDITHERGIRLLIGNDVALSRLVGADGVHFSQNQLLAARTYAHTQPDGHISIACHSIAALDAINATNIDFDAVFVSPVFKSQSPSAQDRPTLGVVGVKLLAAHTRLPVHGLGGINARNINSLLTTGLCGIGAIDLFLD